MNRQDIIRAWKDPQYRNHLEDHDLALVPDHPAGTVELYETELNQIVAGAEAAAGTAGGCSLVCTLWCDSLDGFYTFGCCGSARFENAQ